MPDFSVLPLVLLAALVGVASPGPATVAIATTAAERDRPAALALASGIMTGSLTWSALAAFGLATVMLAHGWIAEVIRYAGAGYLGWLAWKSARAAIRNDPAFGGAITRGGLHAFYLRGLLLHLTNPKAIFFFGALYAVALAPGTTPATLVMIFAAVGLQSAVVFFGYALLFSRPAFRHGYTRATRSIRAASAVLFGAFAVKLATARIT